MTTVEISISGRGAPDDAPTVRDLMDQIGDFLVMTEGVEASIVGDGRPSFEWRVIGLSKNSPATMVAEAVSIAGAAPTDELAGRVLYFTTAGLNQLQQSGERPPYFTDTVLEAAERFARRINQGLADTAIRPDGDAAAGVVLEASGAFAAVRNIEAVRALDVVHPYHELGTVEGIIQSVGKDGWEKPFLILKQRINGADVRCSLSGNAKAALEKQSVDEVVWRRQRVEAWGLLRYRSLGRLSSAEISELRFSPPASELPTAVDILDPSFTGGLPSDEYLARLRYGDA